MTASRNAAESLAAKQSGYIVHREGPGEPQLTEERASMKWDDREAVRLAAKSLSAELSGKLPGGVVGLELDDMVQRLLVFRALCGCLPDNVITLSRTLQGLTLDRLLCDLDGLLDCVSDTRLLNNTVELGLEMSSREWWPFTFQDFSRKIIEGAIARLLDEVYSSIYAFFADMQIMLEELADGKPLSLCPRVPGFLRAAARLRSYQAKLRETFESSDVQRAGKNALLKFHDAIENVDI